MTCTNCQVLRDEVAALRRQLGMSYADGHVMRLMRAMDLTAMQARLILTLHYNSDWVSTHRLEQALNSTAGSIKQQVSFMRKRLGVAFIQSEYAVGYCLGDEAAEKVKEVVG